MKILLALAVCIVGCGESGVKMLSSDGAKLIATCYGTDWPSCSVKACPDGFVVVHENLGIIEAAGIAKCLDHPR